MVAGGPLKDRQQHVRSVSKHMPSLGRSRRWGKPFRIETHDRQLNTCWQALPRIASALELLWSDIPAGERRP